MNRYIVLLFIIAACKGPARQKLKTIDYVTVGKMMDTIKPPYVIDLANHDKRLVFIGCDHNRDSTYPQFKVIEKYFNDIQPGITFNEGGQIADSVHFASLNEAVFRDGETGVLKFLSDKAGIRMMNGDVEDKTEYAIMLKRYPQDQLLLYYLMERLLIPYLYGAYGDKPFEELYNKAINKWFIANGFPVTEKQKSFDGFKQLYQHYTGVPFELKINSQIEKFDYINGGDCKFCAIGRGSKMTRDSLLLQKIDQALDKYDRVMVTFGHGHAISLKPALKEIMDSK
ncbi:hypothetical protein KTO58_03340 [Chitinophaga pendula]|uniref:hypothetical protein n=1 Tax=Chitinophaga TaxID=79328 RepID=UPI000BB0467C|nr:MULTISPECIES: hypothetical protein [Chitinophaga]ASZ14132.1 hypothetical protein CK934_25875 [Chitinophaga sp. MD30]UCJ08234.1 hypothetical protein KTO58_03340 [Chitinophaga pendula]